jgi:hypothetical protein
VHDPGSQIDDRSEHVGVTQHHRAACQPGPGIGQEVVRPNQLGQLERDLAGGPSPGGGVEHLVTDELDDPPAPSRDGVDGEVLERTQHLAEVAQAEGLAQLGRTDEVHELDHERLRLVAQKIGIRQRAALRDQQMLSQQDVEREGDQRQQ